MKRYIDINNNENNENSIIPATAGVGVGAGSLTLIYLSVNLMHLLFVYWLSILSQNVHYSSQFENP